MIKPYEKGSRMFWFTVFGVEIWSRNYQISGCSGGILETLQPSSLVRDHALQVRFILTIVCCTDKGTCNPRAPRNMRKKKLEHVNFGLQPCVPKGAIRIDEDDEFWFSVFNWF